ncbi:MAG: MATE family efflux transporter [Oscillospiraceae bacterium]|nr:MATE family efflux transporter [Oscillospiraceae bacterium]
MFSNQDLKRLIWPLMLEQLLSVSIGMADTLMVARLGETAVSGISLVNAINILLLNLFAALATGGAVVASQYLGRRENANARVAAKQLVLCTLALSVGIMFISLVSYKGMLRFIFGAVEPQVMQNAEVYFIISACSYPFIALYNAGAALFRAMGNSRVSLQNAFIMNVCNIGGNAILIFGFGLGVAGAAYASLISRAVGAVVILYMLKNNGNTIWIDSYLRIKPHKEIIKSILRIGVPNGLENSMFQCGKLILQGLIAGFGTVAIAADAVAGNFASIEVMPAAAIGLALVTVAGRCTGAENYEEVRRYTKKLLALSYAFMLGINVVIILFCRPLTDIYHLSPETQTLAIQMLLCHGIGGVFIWPLSFTLPNGLRAAGDAKFTMWVSIFSMWLFRILGGFVLSNYCGFGAVGVWVAMLIDWAVRSTCFVIRFKGTKWQNKRVV